MDLAIGVPVAAGEEEKRNRPIVDDQRAGQACTPAFADDAAGGVGFRLGFEIGFQIVQDARFAGLEDALEAASGEALGIAGGDLNRSQFRAGPIGRDLRSIFGEKSAANPVVGDDAGETVEDAIERVLDADALFNDLDDVEKMTDFALALVQAVGEELQLVAEPGKGIGIVGTQFRHRTAAAEQRHPGRVAVHPVAYRDDFLDRLVHDRFRAMICARTMPSIL